MSTVPFTYYLQHIPTGKKYYGVRYARGCHPDDLWRTYFTTSDIVHQMIKEYGKESFRYSIRRIFQDSKKALKWEQRVLRRLRVSKRDDWINRAYVSEHFICEMTDEMRLKLSVINTGKVIPRNVVEKVARKNRGKKRTAEAKEKYSESLKTQWAEGTRIHPMHDPAIRAKVSAALKGVPKTEEQKKKMSESAKIRVAKRREDGWKMPQASVERAAKSNIGRKHAPEGVQRMRESKKGKVRYYRPGGSFFMDYPV